MDAFNVLSQESNQKGDFRRPVIHLLMCGPSFIIISSFSTPADE